MNTTTTIDPVAIDTKIAEHSVQLNAAFSRRVNACETARRIVGERKVRIGRSMGWGTTDDEAITNLTAALAAGTVAPHDIHRAQETLSRVEQADTDMAAARAAIDPLDAIYREHRWTRFGEVTGGHIHDGVYCHGGTIRPTTEVSWRIDLSGTTIEDAVKALGPTLCSLCFTSAPVEWTRSAAEVKAEAEADLYCDSYMLTTEQAKKLDRRSRSNYVSCHACGAPSVSVTGRGNKRKHKRPAAEK